MTIHDAAYKLITCIIPKGVALGVVTRLKAEHGIITAYVKTARGSGRITPLAYRGIAGQAEKELLMVPVPSERADEIFEFIYDAAEIGRPHGGMMYQGPLTVMSAFTLPDVPDEA